MNAKTKIGVAAASLAAAAVAGFGVVSATNAVAETPTAPAATSTAAAPGADQQGQRGPGGGMAGHEHTAVTGDELTKVTDAVKAKDSAVTVESVEKDPDGSYDVHGTKDGQPVMFEVSADLSTITENAGGGGRGPGGGGSQDAAVTGDEAQKVIDAVKAKDSAATITTVRKDPDGSYDALGTKDGQNVMFDVSADLNTITEAAGR